MSAEGPPGAAASRRSDRATARALIHLVRHADTVARGRWQQEDDLRPLTGEGIAQADALARRLAGSGATAVLTSPAMRCQMTVAPLAAELGVPLEPLSALAEGSSAEQALEQLLERASVGTIVACTHGDVLGGVLDGLARRGTELRSPRLLPKGGTWELVVEDGDVREALLVPAPAV